MFTKQTGNRLKQMLETEPLNEGELRRVEGMGELYVALQKSSANDDYRFLYTLEINSTPYYFFSKVD